MYLLHRNDVHPALFAIYHDALFALGTDASIEIVLRQFEKQLLHELGFAAQRLESRRTQGWTAADVAAEIPATVEALLAHA